MKDFDSLLIALAKKDIDKKIIIRATKQTTSIFLCLVRKFLFFKVNFSPAVNFLGDKKEENDNFIRYQLTSFGECI